MIRSFVIFIWFVTITKNHLNKLPKYKWNMKGQNNNQIIQEKQ